jgi:hypothetical protein
MTNTDRTIVEWMGKCWHTFPEIYDLYDHCLKCGVRRLGSPNFSPTTDPSDFLELMRYVKGRRDYSRFLLYCCSKITIIPGLLAYDDYQLVDIFTDPPKFCEAVADYFCEGWREK